MSDKKVLARVGKQDITESDVQRLRLILGKNAEQFQGEEGKKNLVEELVHQELLYQDALEKKLDEEVEFQEEMKATKKEMLQQYALRALLKQAQVLPQEVETYYREHEKDYTDEEKQNPDQKKSEIYMQLMLLRQQEAYVKYTKALEKRIPVERFSLETEEEK